jgi:exopolysaccharide biosynthesis predicted pyruvyltransferase EpsI
MSTLAIQYMYLLMTRYFIISEYDSISIRKAPIIIYFVHKQNLVCMNIIHATL